MDAPMRALLAETGGFDFAVSEFIRVSQSAMPGHVIAREVPELASAPYGRAILPIQVQLLGSVPRLLADTAVEACSIGARAIDLNFGCPSPTVIRHDGGSALLKTPTRITRIIEEVRKVLPPAIPVSAKIRLGWESPDEVRAIAQAAYDGGANWIVIHARTRSELYRRGVHWEQVREVVQESPVPVIANGDLFELSDLQACATATGARHFMVGRGALLDPFIGQKFSQHLGIATRPGVLKFPDSGREHEGLLAAIRRFIEIAEPHAQNSGYVPSRIKQWIGAIRAIDEQKIPRFLMTAVGRARTSDEILAILGST